MRKKCGEALKSEIAFQEEVAHEIHTRYIAGGPAFVRRPRRDFTRPRTQRFETVISLLLTMSENSVGRALIKRFKSMENTPSAGGGRIRPEVRRVSWESRFLPAWDISSARLESLAFKCAL